MQVQSYESLVTEKNIDNHNLIINKTSAEHRRYFCSSETVTLFSLYKRIQKKPVEKIKHTSHFKK